MNWKKVGLVTLLIGALCLLSDWLHDYADRTRREDEMREWALRDAAYTRGFADGMNATLRCYPPADGKVELFDILKQMKSERAHRE